MKKFKSFLKEDSRLDDRLKSRLANLVFAPQKELKKPKYKEIKMIFHFQCLEKNI